MVARLCAKAPISAFHIAFPCLSPGKYGRGLAPKGGEELTYIEQTAEDGEDYDCEDGDDDAVAARIPWSVFRSGTKSREGEGDGKKLTSSMR